MTVLDIIGLVCVAFLLIVFLCYVCKNTNENNKPEKFSSYLNNLRK